VEKFDGNLLTAAPKTKLVGISLDLSPKVLRDSISIALNATSTKTIIAIFTGNLSIQTNFVAACRVTVPSGGSLIIENDNQKLGSGLL